MSTYEKGSMSQYDEDMRIIEAATPGPWGYRYCQPRNEFCNPYFYVNGIMAELHTKIADELENPLRRDGPTEANAKFITHFNPVKVREMVEELNAAVALLHAAEYRDPVVALKNGAEFCKAVGEEVANRSKELVEENQQLKALCVELLNAADKCAEPPNYIVQPFLRIFKAHADTIKELLK